MRLLVPGTLVLVLSSTPAGAQDRVRHDGMRYERLVDPSGPWVLHVLRVDLRAAGISVQALRAHDSLRGRERVSEMVRRANARGTKVLGAVNADFFELASGENENNQVIDGEWWKGVKVTDSPYDTYDNVHVQLAIDGRSRATIDRFILDARAWTRGVALPVITVNANPSGLPEGVALYTRRFGARAPRDSARVTARVTAEAVLRNVGRRGDTILYVRTNADSTTASVIPEGGAVLAGYGARAAAVAAIAPGDTTRVLLRTLPALPGAAPARTVVGGWPRVLRDGVNVAGEAATVEGTISRNAEVRHPRTAVGISRDGRTLVLLAVDGRSERSVGMTLVELGAALRRLGAWQGMNLDGGGSTTMVVGDSVVNTPTDATGERAVGNALVVVQARKPR